MSQLELIKEEMEFIKSELWYAKSALDVIELYIAYLKLEVKTHELLPTYKKEIRDGNCYTYAMDFHYPEEFRRAYQKLSLSSMDFNTGFVSRRDEMFTRIPQKVIDNFYSDCEFLNISCFDISFLDIPSHGGYKVLFYVRKYPNSCDFHFIRQNADGRWSHKKGRFDSIELLDSVGDYQEYQLVRTLEIVKPTLK